MSTRDEPISRRALLKLAGAAAIAQAVRLKADATGDAITLAPSEAGTLDAVCARLIPTDENGPGAREAQAWRYIDRALGGFLAPSRQTYATGLADLDRRAMEMRGLPFAALQSADQDAVLHAIEATPFFALLRTHTIQGTFCDPFYGGNANFVGWDLLGYPGVRTIVTADEQKMGITLKPNHKSAYDYAMFHKASDR
ncbi:MAG TPA: gluconate 2-dehydrogenase subunit 3 family protein [Vicinamibacterales bacterium]|nr:gluconate 2-dehydrogenase subunit 3 family protein [Vicinamibacterales bacterium]